MSDRDPKSTRESFAAFKEVVTRFPDSKYAPDAQARMRYLVNALASHEVMSRAITQREAYLAAANRAHTPSSITRRRPRPKKRSCWCWRTTGSAWPICATPPTAMRKNFDSYLKKGSSGRAVVAPVGSRLVRTLIIGAGR